MENVVVLHHCSVISLVIRFQYLFNSVKHVQIVLNKPSGLQVLPGGLFQQRTVLTQLERHASNGTSSYQQSHPVPVHRLGRGTSGQLFIVTGSKWSKRK